MSTTRTVARSFAGGVIAPEMFGRFDLRSYQTGLQQCDNFVVLPHGPVTKRPGFEYGLPIELGSVTRARLIPFATNGDSILIALTETHAYFLRENKPICLTAGAFTAVGSTVTKNAHGYSNGDVVFLGTFSAGYPDVGTYFEVSSVATNTFTATALVGGATVPASGSCGKVYRLTAATATNLLKIARYSQSGQTLTLTTGSTAAVELVRTTDTSWTVAAATFESKSATPWQGVIASTRPDTGTKVSRAISQIKRYKATRVASTGEESISTDVSCISADLEITSVTLAPTAVFTTKKKHGLVAGASPADSDLVRFLSMQSTAGAGTDFSTIEGVNYYVATTPTDYTFTVATVAGSVVLDTSLFDPFVSGFVSPQGSLTNAWVTGATVANPCVFTTNGPHGLYVGDEVLFKGSSAQVGWASLPFEPWVVATTPSAATFTVKPRTSSSSLSTVGYPAYGSTLFAFLNGVRCDLDVAGYSTQVQVQTFTADDVINIYKQDSRSGVYGYIGVIAGSELVDGAAYLYDDNITPDITRTPPEDWNPFVGSGNYPLAVAHNEQRRIFGGTENDPQRVFMSPIGFEWSMAQHFPVLDSDAFDFTVASRVHHRVQHLVAVGDLLALTKNCEFQIKSGDGSAIGPSNVNVRAQSYIGANDVQPAVAESSVVFISASGERPHEISYARDGSGGYVAVDIGVFTPHYFAGYTIVDLAYVRGEVPSLWAVRSDGTLLSCTYLPGEEVRAWHRHTTDGTVQSVAAVFEDYKDRLYIAVTRDVDGTDVLMIERMAPWTFDEIADAQFRDSFYTRAGATSASVTGLWHLEGETVTALGDGVVFPGLTVSSGSITLPEACEKVTVGRAYTSDLMTLPVSAEIQGAGIGRPKNVPRAFLRVYKTSGVKAGPTFSDLYEYNEVAPNYGDPYSLVSSTIEIPLSSTWSEDGAVCVRSDDPRPLCVQAMSFEVTFGG